nr:Rv3654c family TadE-like protein [Streptomyces xanthii]
MWVVVAMAAVGVVFGVVLALGQAVQARHRAGGAADLAALAAAGHWMEGGTDACDLAGRVAGAQGARVVSCAVRGEVAEVVAAAGRGPFAAEVRSRAGPSGPHPETPPGPGPDPEPGSTAGPLPGGTASPEPAPTEPGPASPP